MNYEQLRNMDPEQLLVMLAGTVNMARFYTLPKTPDQQYEVCGLPAPVLMRIGDFEIRARHRGPAEITPKVRTFETLEKKGLKTMFQSTDAVGVEGCKATVSTIKP